MPTPTQGEAAAIPPEPGHAFRDARRLLFILVRGSESLPEDVRSEDWDRVFIGEKRALAIDFWLR
ncbi:hypothetical protein [Jiella sp. M17.18]|uniref:hypothetical protein n=1 Tax=Jiella sp. M17.18 TaxID=3234247 RepID=UPI0034DE2D49